MENEFDIKYSEEEFNAEFTPEDLKLFIQGNLRRKEKYWLDFKSVPKLDTSKKSKNFRKNLKEKIQSGANSGGGVFILGVNQKNSQSPIEGIKDSDNWANYLSQAITDLKLPFLFPISIIDNKTVIFIIIPRQRKIIFYNKKIRIRVGTTTNTIEDSNEIEKIQTELKNKQSGYHIVKNIRNDILRFKKEDIQDDLSHAMRFKILSDSHKENYESALLFSLILAKVYHIVDKQTRSKLFNHEKTKKILQILLLILFGYSFFYMFLTYPILNNVVNFNSSPEIHYFLYILFFLIIIGIFNFIFKLKSGRMHNGTFVVLKLDFPPLIDISDIQERIDRNGFSNGINQILISNLNYMLYSISTWEKYENEEREGRRLKPNIVKNPFTYYEEYTTWLANQKYCNSLKKPPSEDIINSVRLLVLEPVKDKVQGYSDKKDEFKIHQLKGLHYILFHYLFMLEKFEEEYLKEEPVVFLVTSAHSTRKLKSKMKIKTFTKALERID